MNEFDRTVAVHVPEGLRSSGLELVQVNLGLRCNLSCAHCHLEAGPHRPEAMSWRVMEQVLELVRRSGATRVDLTGGAPELNPDLRRFVAELDSHAVAIQLRTNFTALLLEGGDQDLPRFLARHRVKLVGSLPCYLERNVTAQRGSGTFTGSVRAIRHLNALGYGRDRRLELDLVHNPGGPFLPPDQRALEADYHRELEQQFGIAFSNLLTLANMPVGRFLARLRRQGEEESYRRLLAESFNPQTLAGLMCRSQVSVGWDGSLYDCDFNLAQGLPVGHGVPERIELFDPVVHARRRIVTGTHCFGCTAGQGSSCAGALSGEGATTATDRVAVQAHGEARG